MASATYGTNFDVAGINVDAEFTQFAKSGRLTVALDGREVSCVEWCDWDPAYATDAGLRARALAEIGTIVDAVERGDLVEGEDVPSAVLATCRRAAGRA